MPINHYHYHHNLDEQLEHKLDFIIKQQKQLMGKFDDLEALVVELQTSIDAKQASLAAAIKAFEDAIAALQAQVANGATPEQLQTVIDQLTAAKADVESTPEA